MVRSRGLTVRDVLELDTFNGHLASCFAFSPDGGHLAFVVQRSALRGTSHQRFFLANNDRGELWLADLATRRSRPLAAAVEQGIGFYAPMWSPDGQSIAATMIDDTTIRPVAIDAASGTRSLLATLNLAVPIGVPAYHWLAPGRLLYAAMPEGVLPTLCDTERRAPRRAMEAWRKAWNGSETTADILDVVPGMEPEQAFLDPAPVFLVVDLSTGATAPLRDDEMTSEVMAFLKRLDRVRIDAPRQPPRGGFPDWATAIPLPESGRLVAAHDGTGRVVHLTEDDHGSRIDVISAAGEAGPPLFETNLHLRQVRPGTIQDLQYVAADGSELTARLLLPPDHRPGERRPAVAWVYPGHRPGPIMASDLRLNHASPFALQLLAAQGYVVIVPTIPLPTGDPPEDLLPMLALPVAGAVKAAVAAGIVDPARVHVLGQSFGGWAVMGLLATTDLFRSGIAMAGFCDLFSLYGGIDARHRYDDPAGSAFIGPLFVDYSFRFGVPPWRDAERYLRNSPLSFVENIRAPLLITQGDQDYVSITQGEEMFTALRRLDRRVRFLRYWGEGHILSSPANIEHLWQQIIAWLEQAEETGNAPA